MKQNKRYKQNKQNKQYKSSSGMNNHGFSLVELIISIAILAIVMVPLMSNFFRSMQMNKKAEELQVKNNISSNLLEGLKTLTMTEILQQFNSSGSFNIITDSSNDSITQDEVMRLSYDGITDVYTEVDSLSEQETYYFAIDGILERGTAYDALIKIDSLSYRDTDPSIDRINDFPMPDVINLDEKSNSILFSRGKTEVDTMDDEALTAFLNRGQAYVTNLYEHSAEFIQYQDDLNHWKDEYEQAVMEGGPTPAPIPTPIPAYMSDSNYDKYYKSDAIRPLIIKTMNIVVNEDSITYKVSYKCVWSTEDIIYQVSEIKYPIKVENIYLLYEPSIYCFSLTLSDIIEIENENTLNPVNFFVVEQNGASIQPYLTIHRESQDDNITTYTKFNNSILVDLYNSYVKFVFTTNTGVSQSIIPGMVKVKSKDRIYNVTVTLCEHLDSSDPNKYKNILYTLESTKEE